MSWNISLPDAEYYTLSNPKLDGLIREVTDQRAVAFDTETDGLSITNCLPYWWSMSWTSSNGKDRRMTLHEDTFDAFGPVFRDMNRSWVLANAKFDAHMMENKGHPLRGQLIDIQVMHALLHEEEPHGLKEMARTLLGWKWTDFQDTFGNFRSGTCICGGTKASHGPELDNCKKTGCNQYQQRTPLDVLTKAAKENINLLVDYAANDAYGTWRLFKLLDKKLADSPTHSLYSDKWPYINSMWDYYYKTELPFTRVLYTCERNGLRVNKGYLEGITPTIIKDMESLRSQINQKTGRMMKTSGPMLAQYFIDDCGLQAHKMTSGGKSGIKKPSIDNKFLKYVSEEYSGETCGEVAALLIEHEAIAKQFSTYIEKMPGRLDNYDRVHMRLNQDVARTGRLSSSDPNMQNVTTGEKDRFHLRKAFIPRDGYNIVVADYSQLEMRLLAAAAQEPAMMDIFHRNWDIHMGNASFVFNIPYEDLVAAKEIDKQVKHEKLPESALTKEVLYCLKCRADVKNIGFG